MEEGHDVKRVNMGRSDVNEDTMSAMIKLAKKICELCEVGQLTAACLLKVCSSMRRLVTWRGASARSGRSRRHRRACLGAR